MPSRPTTPATTDFLNGGGEMGALIRAHDWAALPLGMPQAWPQALRTALRLVLNTGHPMFLFWGPQHLCFYNDAYSASIGPERHPSSLGQPGRQVWDEIWPVIGPQIEQVMAGLGATWHQNQLLPITRNGRLEDVYWTYSYGPVDDAGAAHGVGGVLVVCTETTATVLAARRLAEETARQRRLFEQAPGFIAIMKGREHVVEFVNNVHRQLFGSDDWVGKTIRQAFPDVAAQGFFELLDGVYATGRPHRAHGAAARFRRPGDGVQETRMLDFVYSPLLDETGAISGVFCEGTDVTERMAAQVALRESELRFGEVANAAPVLIWMSDTSCACTWFNQPWLAFTGRTLAQEQGDGWVQGVHPQDVERCLATYHAAFARREPFRMDYRLRRHDGQWRTVDDNGVPRVSGQGDFLGYIGSCVDVSEQRATAAALSSSEEQLRLATNAAEVGLWDVDTVGNSLFWPPRVKAMFGISADVPVSMADFYAGLHPQDVARVGAAYAAAADPAQRAVYDVEYRTVGKEDGALRWVAAKGAGVFEGDQPGGRCVRMIGTAIDITSRKLAEQRLRASEASLAEAVATLDGLVASAPIGFAFFDPQRRYVRLNAVMARISGLPVQAHIGRSIDEVAPAGLAAIGSLIDTVVATAATLESVELQTQPPGGDGAARAWLAGVFPVFGAGGAVAFVGLTLVDISARRRAEAALREMNETLEAQVAARTAERDLVWRNSRDLLVVLEPDGVFRAVSPSWTAILGHLPDQVVGQHFDAFLWQPDDGQAQAAPVWTTTSRELPNFETRYRHLDGSLRWIAWRTSVEGGLVFAYGRDTSADKAREQELARVEQALRQAQKMEAIGQLTGGIAHDFNNLLQGVAGNFELIRRRPDDPAKVRTWAEAGLRSVDRGAKLTGQLLAFSRSQKLELTPLAVAELLDNMHDMLTRTLGPAVRIQMDLQQPGTCVLGDDTQLEMAVLNLAINARDAMPDGGDLSITTCRRHLGADPELPPGDYLLLSVADTGVGMTPDVVARAFDPFFTTKGLGKGTGLGLSQVYGMMRQAGGAVRIDSRAGGGTAVVLYLPCIDTPAANASAAPNSAVVQMPAVANVLVVDDDPDVRRFLVDSLDALGYSAWQAADGPAGLALLRARVPDAMILDFAMPGMTGAQVAREVRAHHPALPIIFASGFADTAAIEDLPGDKATILRKPFRMDELQVVLAQALGPAAGPRSA